MNTVKLMASTKPDSLLNIPNNQSALIASNHCQPHSSMAILHSTLCQMFDQANNKR